MLKTVWIAFIAFSTPEDCDHFVKTNPSLAEIFAEITAKLDKENAA